MNAKSIEQSVIVLAGLLITLRLAYDLFKFKNRSYEVFVAESIN